MLGPLSNKPVAANTDDTITSEVQPADKPKQSDIKKSGNITVTQDMESADANSTISNGFRKLKEN